MRKYTLVAVVAAAGLLSFFVGRQLGEGSSTATSAATTTTKAAPRTDGTVPAAGEASSDEVGASTRGTDVPSLAAMLTSIHATGALPVGIKIAVETPAQRDERHRSISAIVVSQIGNVPPQKMAALLRLNDESVDLQQSQQAEFTAGSLSHDDYMTQQHLAIVAMLEELRETVTNDEYQKLTGLQPGVDPYEFARTGIGGAAIPPPPPHVDDSTATTNPKAGR